MHPELSVALNFLVSHLYNKLPRRRVDVFAEELEKALKTKFQDHWYPEEPFKGSGYRSIRIVEGKLDPAFRIASQLSGLTLEEILEHLPKGLTIWIDPDEVSYRIGETGQVTILYFNKRTPAGSVPSCLDPLSVTPNNFGSYPADNMSNMEQLNYLFNCFGTRAMESSREQDLSFSFEKMKLDGNSPIGGRPTYSHPFQNALQANSNNQLLLGLNKNKNSNCFTAAAFAQTKFGSTKMKNHSSHQARPTRLTATSAELQNRLNMAAQMNALNARSPGSFMPYMGFHPHPPNGGWPLERQTSAPSSCLNSPSSGFMPMSNGHLFSHLVQPSPGMSRQSPNESLPTPVSSSATHSPSGLSLIEQAVLKQDLQFSGLPKGIQHQISPHSPDKLNPSPILPSPSTESPSSEKSLSNDVDWNSFVSNYPNLHHLLVAN